MAPDANARPDIARHPLVPIAPNLARVRPLESGIGEELHQRFFLRASVREAEFGQRRQEVAVEEQVGEQVRFGGVVRAAGEAARGESEQR